MSFGWAVARHSVRILFPLLLAVSACAGPGQARTWLVQADGSGDAPTIQAAVDSAAVGDTVLVASGTYSDIHQDLIGDFSVVEMKSGVVLRSESGPADTIIDISEAAEPARGVLCFNCDDATIVEGFTITGGDTYFGAGAYISGGAPLVQQNHFDQAYGGSGGAVTITFDSAATIRENLFTRNTACCGPGGAILVDGPAAPIIELNRFVDNDGFRGGAVALSLAGGTIRDNEFSGNLGTEEGALSVWRGNVEIRDNIFKSNQASSGGGAVIIDSADEGLLAGNLVIENEANGNGGGYLLLDSSPQVSGCTVAGNSSFAGGGIYPQGSSFPAFDHVLVAFNDSDVQVECQHPSAASWFCCDVFDSVGLAFGGDCDDPTGTDGNFSEDPLFCPADDYTLQDCSPCAPNEDCDQIGARAVECPCDQPSPAQAGSWGSIKARFRPVR